MNVMKINNFQINTIHLYSIYSNFIDMNFEKNHTVITSLSACFCDSV
jgi:hypothetical protein